MECKNSFLEGAMLEPIERWIEHGLGWEGTEPTETDTRANTAEKRLLLNIHTISSHYPYPKDEWRPRDASGRVSAAGRLRSPSYWRSASIIIVIVKTVSSKIIVIYDLVFDVVTFQSNYQEFSVLDVYSLQ